MQSPRAARTRRRRRAQQPGAAAPRTHVTIRSVHAQGISCRTDVAWCKRYSEWYGRYGNTTTRGMPACLGNVLTWMVDMVGMASVMLDTSSGDDGDVAW
jgi:hypothetical protein